VFEQTKLILYLPLHLIPHKKTAARRGVGFSGARKWAMQRRHPCRLFSVLSCGWSGKQLIQDKAKQKRKDRL